MSATVYWQPRPRQWWGLGVALAVSAAPHLLRLPLWLTAIWLLAVGWRMSLGVKGRPKPALLIRMLSTLAAGVALYLHFGTVVGREAGSALLVMMAGLKLLELKQRRDATLIVFLCYLLLAIQFMFSQDILTALYVCLAGIVVTAVRIEQSNQVGERPWEADVRLATRMLLQAVPLMLMLFVLFPRLPGPLWSMPSDAHAARTGLSGEMEPGRFSELVLSERVAFRVEFVGALPPPAQRYWRGPVFEMTNGRRWWGAEPDPAELLHRAPAPPFEPAGPAYQYTLTLEPTGTAWLPALEYSYSIPPQAQRLPSLELKAQQNNDNLRQDVYTSYPLARLIYSDVQALTRNLRVPDGLSTRVRRLAQGWRAQAHSEWEVVTAALTHFNTQPYVYTLQPPLLGQDPVDEFLFESRRGFCEHYASAFTLLMRAAGIPARVVTGYQGGELNPVGDYMIVRQSDAHAWAEVWLKDRGWVRVDPTAAVAPERIERRIDLSAARNSGAVRFQLDEDSAVVRLWRRSQLSLDALNNGWNHWVISYSADQQRGLLSVFGIASADWRQLIWSLLIGVAIIVTALVLVLLRRQRPRRDPVQRVYRRFIGKLTKAGIDCPPQEGPQDLLRRLQHTAAPLAAAARPVIELYIQLRYRAQPPAKGLEQLRRAVRDFAVQR